MDVLGRSWQSERRGCLKGPRCSEESGTPFLVNAIPEIVPGTRSRLHRRTLGNSYQLFLNLREKASKRRHSAIADTGRPGENECWGRPSSLNSDFGYFLSFTTVSIM